MYIYIFVLQTNLQHDKIYFHNNTFYTAISKTRGNLPLMKFKGKIIIHSILEDYLDIFTKQNMTIFKLNIFVHLKLS